MTCKGEAQSRWRSIAKEVYVYAVLLIIVLVLTFIKGEPFGKGNFLNWENSLVNLLRMAAPMIVVSSGFTLIMIAGKMDLSVGSNMSLCAVVYSMMLLHGMSMLPALLLTMVLGVFLGLINGVLVAKLRITPVIATLITMNLYQGVARYLVPAGQSAIKSTGDLSLPNWINDFARKDFIVGLPLAFFVSILVVVLLVIVQKKTILGKYTVAIGGNSTAAELSGINSVAILTILYTICGVLASLAGVMKASYMSLGNPLSGVGVETDCIIAVLLGGAAFTGGEGSCSKTVIGALIIMSITVGLKSVIPEYWQTLAKGVVMIVAVVLNHLLAREEVAA